MLEEMEKVYYDAAHPLGFTGDRKALIRLMPNAEKWLQSQPTYTLHKPVRRKFKTRKYRTSAPNRQWQADLVDMQQLKKKNNGYGYILTCIDVFTRFAWAVPLKTKAYTNVINGFKTIFKSKKPKLLQTDQGLEFENKHVQEFFKTNGVHQFSVKSPYKAALVERFHRTLRSRMYRYFTRSGTQRWVDVLPDLLHSYNNRGHSSILGFSPTEATADNNADKIWENQNRIPRTKKKKPAFKVNDMVRLALVKKTFDRGYTPNWTEEIFQVIRVDDKSEPYMYHVKDADGEEIDGRYYKEELQKVDSVYRIEKIVKTNLRGGKLYYYVKWMGYAEPEWISEDQLA